MLLHSPVSVSMQVPSRVVMLENGMPGADMLGEARLGGTCGRAPPPLWRDLRPCPTPTLLQQLLPPKLHQ